VKPAAGAVLPVTVSQIVDEGSEARTFRLAIPEGDAFSFRPGQFVVAALPGRPDERRPYSISSSPLETEFIEITVGRSGGVGTRLFALEGGETLLISGPQGAWQFRDEDRSAVLLCANIGLAPLRSMIRYVLDKGLPNNLALLYAVKKPSCVLYRQELKDFARQGVKVHVTLTDADVLSMDEPWDGAKGPIALKDIRRIVKDYKSSVYYLCGPQQFVDAWANDLCKAGIDADAVLASGWGEF